jgi:hypothetical protein
MHHCSTRVHDVQGESHDGLLGPNGRQRGCGRCSICMRAVRFWMPPAAMVGCHWRWPGGAPAWWASTSRQISSRRPNDGAVRWRPAICGTAARIFVNRWASGGLVFLETSHRDGRRPAAALTAQWMFSRSVCGFRSVDELATGDSRGSPVSHLPSSRLRAPCRGRTSDALPTHLGIRASACGADP